MSNELVSILIPTYNREKLIGETIQSALAQTYSNIEVIVVDNASTDSTWDKIKAIAANDCRVKAFHNENNIGPVRNWLRCIHEARGIYGKILWSDDLLHQDFLAKAVPEISNPDVGFVYSPALIFEGDDPLLGELCFDTVPSGMRPTAEFIEGSLLAQDYPVSPGCALFRLSDMRDCLLESVPNRVGSDFAMHAIGNDLLLFLLIAARYRHFVRLVEPLSYFRAHEGSITLSAERGKITLHYDIAKAWFVTRCILPPSLVARFNALLALHSLTFYRNAFSLNSVDDFYPETAPRPIAKFWLVPRAIKLITRKINYKIRKIKV